VIRNAACGEPLSRADVDVDAARTRRGTYMVSRFIDVARRNGLSSPLFD